MRELPSQFDPAVSHVLEVLAARAWPADEVHEVEGWVLRRTEGVDRRRCNSVLPPADAAHAVRTVELALTTAEELDIAPVIQVSPAEGHLQLDRALEDRGMVLGGRSLVLAGQIGRRPREAAPRPDADAASPSPLPSRRVAASSLGDGTTAFSSLPRPAARSPIRDVAAASSPLGCAAGSSVGDLAATPASPSGASGADRVTLGGLTGEWVEAWASVSGLSGTGATAELVLSQLGVRARFATVTDAGGAPVAVGVGVVEEGWLGIFSLATAPEVRRRGVASAVMDALERWAVTRGAHRTYLQVERDNASALAFYARRGFHIAHSYHYRSA